MTKETIYVIITPDSLNNLKRLLREIENQTYTNWLIFVNNINEDLLIDHFVYKLKNSKIIASNLNKEKRINELKHLTKHKQILFLCDTNEHKPDFLKELYEQN